MLNPWQALLLGRGYPQQPSEDDQTASSGAPSLSGDAGGAAAPPAAVAGAQNPGMLGSVAAPTAASVQPQQNPADQIDPNTGSRVGDLQQGLLATLGQLGPILMAAGQRMSPAQRAQILTMGAAAIGGGPRNVLNAAQARLMQQKASNEDANAKRLNAGIASMMQDPSVPPSIKQMMLADPSGAMKLWAERNNPAQTSMDQEMALARAAGVDPKQFYQDKFGKDDSYQFTANPMGGYMVGNKTTGDYRVVGQNNAGDYAALGLAPPDGQPGQAAPQGGAAPASAGQPPRPGAQGNVPANAANAFGLGASGLQHIIRPAMSVVGNGAALPNGGHQSIVNQTAFHTLHNQIVGALATDIDGRQTQAMRDELQSILPNVGSAFTDPSFALDYYKGVQPRLLQKLSEVQSEGANALRFQDKTRTQNAMNQYKTLLNLTAGTQHIINSLQANAQGRAYNPAADRGRAALSGASAPSAPTPFGAADSIVGFGQ